MNKNEIKADSTAIAFCGLYCGACGKFAKGKCPGCAKNDKALWCGVRKCCLEQSYKSCADCKEFSDPKDCRDFHNPISRVIGFIFRSDRRAGIEYIRKNGYDAFAENMAAAKRMAVKR